MNRLRKPVPAWFHVYVALCVVAGSVGLVASQPPKPAPKLQLVAGPSGTLTGSVLWSDGNGNSFTSPATAPVNPATGAATLPLPVPSATLASGATSAVPPGTAVVLTYGGSNAFVASLNGAALPAVSGTTTVSPQATTTYTLTVVGVNGATATAAATVTVQATINPPPPPVVKAGVPPTSFFVGLPTNTATKSGSWCDPNVWFTHAVPSPTDQVYIPAGVTVTLACPDCTAGVVEVYGTLTFSRTAAATLTATTVSVVSGGTLDAGTTASPLPEGSGIVFADVPLDLTLTSADPEQWGHGLIVQGTGICRIAGAYRTPAAPLATDVTAATTVLTLGAPVTGWKAGDVLLLPDVRPQKGSAFPSPSFTEQVKVAAVSADGLSVTLAAPTMTGATHLSVTDPNTGTVYHPSVMNLTRGVVLRSANPAGTRAHTVFTQRADVVMSAAELRDLGRTQAGKRDNTTWTSTGTVSHIGTNQIGRYSWHAHHAVGPATQPTTTGYQFVADGLSVWSSARLPSGQWPAWGASIHNCSWGTFRNSVLYGYGEYGVVLEDGAEYQNTVSGNYVCTVGNTLGVQGGGYRLLSLLNVFTGNTAYDCRGTFDTYGVSAFLKGLYSLYGNLKGDVQVAGKPGDDPMTTPLTVNVQSGAGTPFGRPILQFESNTAYGCASGMTWWWINAKDGGALGPVGGTLKNSVVLNAANYGVFEYSRAHVTQDGLVIVSPSDANHTPSPTLEMSDYSQTSCKYVNCSLATGDSFNVGWGILTDGCALVNCQVSGKPALNVPLASARGQNPTPVPAYVIVDGGTLKLAPGAPNPILRYSAGFPATPSNIDLTQKRQVFVNRSGQWYKVYLTQQAASYVPPATDASKNLIGCTPPLAAGAVQTLTNAQIAAQQAAGNPGYCPVCGEVAPSNCTTDPTIDGLLLPIPALPADASAWYAQAG